MFPGWRTCTCVKGCLPTASRSSPTWTGSASPAGCGGPEFRCGPGARAGRRPGDPPELAGILAELYVHQRLTIAQAAVVVGMPARTVSDRLRRYGIRARTRGGWERQDRRVLPADALRDLYSRDGLAADDVGRKLDASRKAVLRNAHDFGLPVRVGGAVPQSGPAEIELVNALYADALIDGILAEHKIPRVPAGGPVWQRFPEPVPLSRRLVADLYWRCGVGLNHIELLTGRRRRPWVISCAAPELPSAAPVGARRSCGHGEPNARQIGICHWKTRGLARAAGACEGGSRVTVPPWFSKDEGGHARVSEDEVCCCGAHCGPSGPGAGPAARPTVAAEQRMPAV